MMDSIHLTKSKVAWIYYPIYYSFGNYACIKTFSKYRIRTEIKSKCTLLGPQNSDAVSIRLYIISLDIPIKNLIR